MNKENEEEAQTITTLAVATVPAKNSTYPQFSLGNGIYGILSDTSGTAYHAKIKILQDPRIFVSHLLNIYPVEIKPNGQIFLEEEFIEQDTLAKSMHLDFIRFYNEFDQRGRSEIGKRNVQEFSAALEEKINSVRKESLNRLMDLVKFDVNSTTGFINKFIFALTEKDDSLTVAVLKHWLWLVKRKMFALPVNTHLMPILYGKQGCGKSRAIQKLISVVQDLVFHSTVFDIADSRVQPILAKNYISFLDEMAGAARTDVEQLKRIITSDVINVRKLYGHNYFCLTQNSSFIGATNKPLTDQIKDSTGMRRFFQIDVVAKANWDLINSIDYLEMWKSVDENNETGFLKDFENQLRNHQEGLVVKEDIDDFLEELEIKFNDQSIEFISTADFYRSFVDWCIQSGIKKIITKQVFGQKLSSRGCKAIQKKINGKAARGYMVEKLENCKFNPELY